MTRSRQPLQSRHLMPSAEGTRAAAQRCGARTWAGRWSLALLLLACVTAAPAQAVPAGWTAAVTASAVARRQEASLPAVEPTPLTVTVANTGAGSLQVESVVLAFTAGADSVSAEYRVTAPALPVSIPAASTRSLVFRVTPEPGATVCNPVNLTATVTVTGSSAGASSVTTAWTVTPGPAVTVGQDDAFSLERVLKGMYSPSAVHLHGTRLFVADTTHNRVLIWNSLPTSSRQDADVVLGQPNLSTATEDSDPSASTLGGPIGIACDGTRLFVADSNFSRVLIWNTIPTTHGQPADVVLGQPDFASRTQNNGGRSASTLAYPSGVATDGTRLFVGDGGNNRVLIWDTLPTVSHTPADLVLGQSDFTTAASGCSATSLRAPRAVLVRGTRLFVADYSNNRVLVWNSIPTANLTPASLVLGQADFTSSIAGHSASTMSNPFGVDSDGARLLVSDYRNCRVLVWNTLPTVSGQAADAVIGQPDLTSSLPNNGGLSAATLHYPTGAASDGTRLFVTDLANNRVLGWASFPASGQTSASLVLGQPGFTTFWNEQTIGGAGSLFYPFGVSSDGLRLLAADTGNSRVLIWNRLPTTDRQPADVVLGQPDFTSYDVNSGGLGAASLWEPDCAFSDGNRLFVSDTANNRVLIWNTIPIANQTPADLVLGQPDPTSTEGSSGPRGAASLSGPRGLFSDGTRLFVADTGNHRVLIWNSIPTANQAPADVVLGQSSFSSGGINLTTQTASTLWNPSGVLVEGSRLIVADQSNNRVLIWNTVPTANGQPAEVVLGQPHFGSRDFNDGHHSASTLREPYAVASDGTRLFVSELSNHRVLVWNRIPTVNQQPADGVLGQRDFSSRLANDGGFDAWRFDTPRGLCARAGRLFVADSRNDRVLGFDVPTDEPPPLTASLVFDRTSRRYLAETLAVTATFSSPLATAPLLAISGGTAGPSANDVAAAPMLASADPLVWSYSRTLAADDLGLFAVTLAATATAGNPLVMQPANNTFTVEPPPLTPALLRATLAAPATVARGRTLPVTVSVTNSGEATASDLTVELLAGVSGASVVSRGGRPAGLAGAGNALFEFDVLLPLGAVPGQAPLTATVGWSATPGGSAVTTSATASFALVNNRPTAVISGVASGTVISPVSLSGSGSHDGPAPGSSEGDALVYFWAVLSAPAGSAVTDGSIVPNGTPAATAQFAPDRKGVYEVALVVNDTHDDSTPATALVTVGNSAPVAVLAPVAPAAAGTLVILDASGSSDADAGDSPSFRWTLDSRPPASQLTASAVVSSGPASPLAAFTPDVAGNYLIVLVVNDGTTDSPAVSRTVTVTAPLVVNHSPEAFVRLLGPSAGGSRQVELDATQSADPDEGASLTYAWRFVTAPAGAAAPAAVSTPVLAYDAAEVGRYTVVVRVTDAEGLWSEASVTFEVEGRPPTAVVDVADLLQVLLPHPEAPASLSTTSVVELQGARSYDPHGHALTYHWAVVAAPDLAEGLTRTGLAQFDAPEAAVTRLVFSTAFSAGTTRLAGAGVYRVALTVSNGAGQTGTATVDLVALDPSSLLPAADPGLDATYRVAFLTAGGLQATVPDPLTPGLLQPFVRLDGHESAGSGGGPLDYAWSVARDASGRLLVPDGSSVSNLAGATSSYPTWVPDREGAYVFELVVSNAGGASAPRRVTINIEGETSRPPTAEPALEDGAGTLHPMARHGLMTFAVGEQVTLRGDESSDPDEGEHATLSYRWRQVSGPSVLETAQTTQASWSFVAPRPGLYGFELRALDARGLASDAVPIRLAVRPGSVDGSLSLALTATAAGVAGAGEDLGEGLTEGRPASLRVMAPTTVTLVATAGSVAAGARRRFVWSQVEGPTVALASVGEQDTTSSVSVTSFEPTTSRVHVFKCVLELLDDSGIPTGFGLERKLRVIVETASSRVPTASATSVVELAAGGTGPTRLALSGQGQLGGGLASGSLHAFWEQLSGPRVVIDDPYAFDTFADAPDLGDGRARTYVFAFYADTGADRSEPYVVFARPGTAVAAGGETVQLFLQPTPGAPLDLMTLPLSVSADWQVVTTGLLLPAGLPLTGASIVVRSTVPGAAPVDTVHALVFNASYPPLLALTLHADGARRTLLLRASQRGSALTATVVRYAAALGTAGGCGCDLNERRPASDGLSVLLMLGVVLGAVLLQKRRRAARREETA